MNFELRIDKAGRLVLPKSVRTMLGITTDTPLELVQSADGVLLRRVPDRPALRQVEGLWVHQGAGTTHAAADWAAAVDGVRNERADNAFKT